MVSHLTLPTGSLLEILLAVGDCCVSRQAHSNGPEANLHELTFGISGILGVFGFLSLTAGPLALGALVLATLFGGVLGTSIGLIVDTVLGTNILIEQGVGWSAVAMLGMLDLAARMGRLVWRYSAGHRGTGEGSRQNLYQ